MDDFLRVEVCESAEHSFGNLAQDLLACSPTEALDFFVDAVERSTLAELHGDRDSGGRRVYEGAIVPADVLGRTLFVETELADDLFLDIRIGICSDDLERVSDRSSR